jgi:membrane-associated phospholipid phosphatase
MASSPGLDLRAPTVRRLLALSALALLAFFILYALAVHTELGQRADEAALAGGRAAPEQAQSAADRLLRVISVGSLLAALLVLSGLAWLRRRPGLLLVPAAVIGTSLVATELLKHVILTRPVLLADPQLLGNSYPSGHTTVAASIGIAAVLIAAPRLRGAVAFAAAGLAAAAGVFVVTADWHRPSDPIGSYLLTLSVAAAVMGLLRASRPADATAAQELPRAAAPTAARLELAALLAGLAVFVGAGVVASLRYGAEVDWNRLHAAYLLAGAAIVIAAGLCVAALLRALGRPPPGARRSDRFPRRAAGTHAGRIE